MLSTVSPRFFSYEETEAFLRIVPRASPLYGEIREALFSKIGIVTLSNGWKINTLPTRPDQMRHFPHPDVMIEALSTNADTLLKELVGQPAPMKRLILTGIMKNFANLVLNMEEALKSSGHYGDRLSEELKLSISRYSQLEKEKQKREKRAADLFAHMLGLDKTIEMLHKEIDENKFEHSVLVYKLEKGPGPIFPFSLFVSSPDYDALFLRLRDESQRLADKLDKAHEHYGKITDQLAHELFRMELLSEEMAYPEKTVKELGASLDLLRKIKIGFKTFVTSHRLLANQFSTALENEIADAEILELEEAIKSAHSDYVALMQTRDTSRKVNFYIENFWIIRVETD